MRHALRCKSSTSLKRYAAKGADGQAGGGLLFKASHCELEIKAAEVGTDTPEGSITGYGSKFGLVDSYNEQIKKGAFKGSLSEWKKRKKPIPMLWQHMGNEPIGAWTKFSEDDTGLLLEGQLLMELPRAKEALALVRANIVTGLSIGYMEIDADPWWDPEREGPREIRKLDLREVSVVTFPALREAQLDAVKAAIARGERPTLREFQRYIQRELGLSRADAEEVADSGYKDWIRREAGPEALHDPADATVQRDVAEMLKQFETPIF